MKFIKNWLQTLIFIGAFIILVFLSILNFKKNQCREIPIFNNADLNGIIEEIYGSTAGIEIRLAGDSIMYTFYPLGNVDYDCSFSTCAKIGDQFIKPRNEKTITLISENKYYYFDFIYKADCN